MQTIDTIIPTGLENFDELIGGFTPGLHFIGARPQMGNTSLALSLIRKICTKDKKPVGLISTEYNMEQLLFKCIQLETGVSLKDLSCDNVPIGYLTSKNEILGQYFDQDSPGIVKKPLFHIYSDEFPYIDNVVDQAIKWKTENNIEILFVDFLQNLHLRDRGDLPHNRVLELLCYKLAELSKELKIPIVIFFHLNRVVEQEKLKKPTVLSTAASIIEELASTLTFLYRAEYYADMDKGTDWYNTINDPKTGKEILSKGLAELIVVKNRYGFDKANPGIGTALCNFNPKTCLFS